MNVRRLVSLVLALLLALTLLPSFAAAEDTGSISGKLVNRTPNGDGVAGQTVELIAYDGEKQTGSWSATSGADGSFAFEGLPTSGQSYFVTVNYKGAYYYSEVIDLSAQPKWENLELAVYDTTEDPKDISISRSHIIVDFDGSNQYLVILEALVVSNTGDRAYVGAQENADGKRETLRMPLPEGAMHVRLGEGFIEGSVRVEDAVVIDTQAVPPGSRQLVMNYFLPYQRPNAAAKWTPAYPTAKTSLVIKDVGQQVAFEGFKQEEKLNISGKTYFHLTAEDTAPGDELSVSLSGIPDQLPQSASMSSPAAADANNPSTFLVAVVGLGIAGVVTGVAYPVLRRKRQDRAPGVGSAAVDEDEWDRLVSEIADLDDRFEAGELAREDYERQRDEKKRRLRAVARRGGRV